MSPTPRHLSLCETVGSNFNINPILKMYRKELTRENKTFTIELESDPNDANVILNLDYVGLQSRKISNQKLNENFDILIPEKIGKSIFGDDKEHLTSKMLGELKNILQKHNNQYGKFKEEDLIIYVAETIIFLETYIDQVLNKSFDDSEKKRHFITYFKFYKMQLEGKYDEFLKNL